MRERFIDNVLVRAPHSAATGRYGCVVLAIWRIMLEDGMDGWYLADIVRDTRLDGPGMLYEMSHGTRRQILLRLFELNVEIGGKWLMRLESPSGPRRHIYQKTKRLILEDGCLGVATPPKPPSSFSVGAPLHTYRQNEAAEDRARLPRPIAAGPAVHIPVVDFSKPPASYAELAGALDELQKVIARIDLQLNGKVFGGISESERSAMEVEVGKRLFDFDRRLTRLEYPLTEELTKLP